MSASSCPPKSVTVRKVQRLAPSRKQLVDTVKLIAYRGETALAAIVREELARTDDARSLLRDLFCSEADLLPDLEQRVLRVQVHPMSNPRANRAIAHLLEHLNAAEFTYPGTKLQLVYSIAGEAETPNSVPQQNPTDQEVWAYDKAADDEAVHRLLHKAGIKPLIENRALWKGEPERMLPGHTGRSNLVYDESGTIHCYDKMSMPMVRHRMAYVGHEVNRGTLKYRCPARHEGWSCPSDARCNEGRTYGLVARIKSELDLRRFPPIPRMTKQFERLYKGRTAVERVNARLKLYWGADDGNVVGARRFHAMVGVVMLVHLALGTALAGKGRGTIKTLSGTRLSPIAQALNEQIEHERSTARER